MATVFQRDPSAPWEPIAKDSDNQQLLPALNRLVIDYEQLQQWAQKAGSAMHVAWNKDAIKAARTAIRKAEKENRT